MRKSKICVQFVSLCSTTVDVELASGAKNITLRGTFSTSHVGSPSVACTLNLRKQSDFAISSAVSSQETLLFSKFHGFELHGGNLGPTKTCGKQIFYRI